jgi:quinoprotein relay system zinc metallohydrolase 2
VQRNTAFNKRTSIHIEKMREMRAGLFVTRTFWRVVHCCILWTAASVVLAADGAGDALSVEEVAPGVFVHQGVHEEGVTPENLGAIANIGFIIGERCVAVIDSGGSFAEGSSLRVAIKMRTAAPVCYVINTHGHPDHVYGNAAFTADKPHFVGHRNLATSMAARHPYYFRYLERTLGSEHARQSALVPPDVVVVSSRTIDLGKRKLTLRAWPTSHTDSDLTVFDEKSGTLWLGDLLFRERVPVVDGKLSGWLATMKSLDSIAAARVVPGHGTVSSEWPAAMVSQARYLRTLQVEVRAAVRAGHSIQQAVAEVGASERDQWQLFNAFHPRNVTVAFAEVEWEN